MRIARTLASVVLVACAALLGACRIIGPGYIGPIQPPALDIPVPVNDLGAIQFGDEIIAGFSIPDRTTEGLPLKSLRAVDLYAGPNGPTAGDPNAWMRTATHYSVTAQASVPARAAGGDLMPGAFKRSFPAQAWIGKDLVLRVRATGPKGRLSQWSLPFSMSVIAPLMRPTGVTVDSRKDGVRLTWQGSGPKYHVLRAAGTEMLQPLTDTDKAEYLDESAQFGTPYQYLIVAFTDDRHQSLASDPLPKPITPVDVFPPEVPAGLTVTVGVNAIELQWEINTEADFRGYNVFRSIDNGPFERVASLIPAATYHDTDVQPGKTYRYQVSAADLLNNESNRSSPVESKLE